MAVVKFLGILLNLQKNQINYCNSDYTYRQRTDNFVGRHYLSPGSIFCPAKFYGGLMIHRHWLKISSGDGSTASTHLPTTLSLVCQRSLWKSFGSFLWWNHGLYCRTDWLLQIDINLLKDMKPGHSCMICYHVNYQVVLDDLTGR